MEKKKEALKNIMIMLNENLKVNIQMEKELIEEKNMI